MVIEARQSFRFFRQNTWFLGNETTTLKVLQISVTAKQ